MADNREWHLYILRCADRTFYCGIALDVDTRVLEHNAGRGPDYTARRRPVSLVYSEAHPTKSAACKRERQVKRWGRAKKEQLVRGFPSTQSGGALIRSG